MISICTAEEFPQSLFQTTLHALGILLLIFEETIILHLVFVTLCIPLMIP